MTVRDLKILLEEYDDDLPVKFSYNYGDYWGTIVAKEIGTIEEGMTIPSSYHNMDKVVDESDDAEDCILLS